MKDLESLPRQGFLYLLLLRNLLQSFGALRRPRVNFVVITRVPNIATMMLRSIDLVTRYLVGLKAPYWLVLCHRFSSKDGSMTHWAWPCKLGVICRRFWTFVKLGRRAATAERVAQYQSALNEVLGKTQNHSFEITSGRSKT